MVEPSLTRIRGFDSGRSFPRAPAQPAWGEESWLSRPARSASWSCRNHGDFVRGLGVGFADRARGGFDSGRSFPRAPAQPAWGEESWLSRPARSASWSCRNHGEGVWRLVCRVPGGFDSGRSFLATRLNQLQEAPHSIADPRHESQKKNGSTSCGDVEPSNLRVSCAGWKVERGAAWAAPSARSGSTNFP